MSGLGECCKGNYAVYVKRITPRLPQYSHRTNTLNSDIMLHYMAKTISVVDKSA